MVEFDGCTIAYSNKQESQVCFFPELIATCELPIAIRATVSKAPEPLKI